MDENQVIPVYLSLGSNLADRKSNLEVVRSTLPPEVVVREASSLFETEPWGYVDQPDFLNQILLAETYLSAADLLAYVIIFYGDQIIQEPDLEIPHPRFRERAFVLVPLAEISPDLLVPGTDQTVSDLLEELDSSGVHRYQE